MTLFVISLMMVLFLAWVLDIVMTDAAVMNWRKATVQLRAKFFELNVIELTLASNVWFLGFFEAVYGKKFFSTRRLVTSAASTLLAMAVISLFIEFAEWPAFHVLFRGLISAFVIFTIINFVADYLSLQETYWLMKLSQNRKLFGISLLVVLDIVLTGIIYLVIVLSSVFMAYLFQNLIEVFFTIFPEPVFHLLDEDEGIILFFSILMASTYFTSTLWIGFVFTAIAVRILQALSPTLRRVIHVIGESERPAFATVGFVCLLTAASFGTYRIVIWLVG